MLMTVIFKKSYCVQVNKERIFNNLADPFIFAGISGHFSILLVLDSEIGKFVCPSYSKKPSNTFLIAYLDVPDLERNKMNVTIIELQVDVHDMDKINYIFVNPENKATGIISFVLNEELNECKTTINVEIEEEETKSFFTSHHVFSLSTPEHIVEDHIVPYLEKLKELTSAINLKRVAKFTGTPLYVLKEASKLIQYIKIGGLFISSPEVEGIFTIIDGIIENGYITIDNQTYYGVKSLYTLIAYDKEVTSILFDSNIGQMVYDLIKKRGYEEVIR